MIGRAEAVNTAEYAMKGLWSDTQNDSKERQD